MDDHKILLTIIGSVSGLGLILYLLKYFTVKFFDQLICSVKSNKEYIDLRIAELTGVVKDNKKDICQRLITCDNGIKELYAKTDKIDVLEERIKHLTKQ